MVNYEKSVIYKLCCKDPTIKEVYVGSTTNFRKRKNQHKECCTNVNSKKHGYPVYLYIRHNGGWDNWNMVQVTEVNAKDKRELHATERRYVSKGVVQNTPLYDGWMAANEWMAKEHREP